MATVHTAQFAVGWTTSYLSLLADGTGTMTTRGSYSKRFATLGADLVLPWSSVTEPASWNRFWSSYLGRPGAMRNMSADAAWEHLVPFLVWNTPGVVGPAVANIRVLLHPCAVSVIVTVTAQGSWPLAQLAEMVAGLRKSNEWATVNKPHASRTLQGIAADLRDSVANQLCGAGPLPEPRPETMRSVAAVIEAAGQPSEYELSDATAGGCAAGMAALGPPGILDAGRLLARNNDTNLAAQFYVLKNGHTIWNPSFFLNRPPNSPMACLIRNHSDLVAQIEALVGIVNWAVDQLSAKIQIPREVQPLLRVAAQRLHILYAGNMQITYRCGVAASRIQPALESIKTVLSSL